ncbi:MAG: RHS repeat-associated core domain-containing protein [Candidatus Aminicenantes bacterium]|nr:RHS repeat-associated core domain-containing protein [Candidatus Aminicenantes bacterium]
MRTSNYYEGSETRRGGAASPPSEPLRGGPVIGAGTDYSHPLRIDRSLPNSPNLERQEQKSAGKRPGKTLEASYTNTYYIWSFDGKLMAEYDHSGICVKEYIYFGNKLVAEYLPVEDKYYYHLSDQINSTRIVTDGAGSVVYSAAHGPFGDVQKTWVNTYDPKQKFSGKERETYSDLDYFGARYYDSHSYRFVSVDPIRNRDAAIANPQLWNLYSYCKNNPITYLDPDGRDVDDFSFQQYSDSKLRQEWGDERTDTFIDNRNTAQREASIFVATEVGTAVITAGTLNALSKAKWLKKIFSSRKAYNAAKAGGKHAGQLKRFLGMSKSQVTKSIASFENNIAKHRSWIKNPSSKISNWNTLSHKHQANIIHHWKQDIKRAREFKSIAKQVLNK